MSSTSPRSHDLRRLRAQLRDGDPAAIAPDAEAAALARLARRLAAAAPHASPPRPRRLWLTLGPVVAAALVAAVALLGRSAMRRPAAESAKVEPLREAPARPGEAFAETPRQLQFETPGGTRVVWLLDPNLSL